MRLVRQYDPSTGRQTGSYVLRSHEEMTITIPDRSGAQRKLVAIDPEQEMACGLPIGAAIDIEELPWSA